MRFSIISARLQATVAPNHVRPDKRARLALTVNSTKRQAIGSLLELHSARSMGRAKNAPSAARRGVAKNLASK
jgi:hypothetical protein